MTSLFPHCFVCHISLPQIANSKCLWCRTVSYCSDSCRQQDWDNHKKSCKPKFQILHFDLNNTLTLLDSTKGKITKKERKQVLSESETKTAKEEALKATLCKYWMGEKEIKKTIKKQKIENQTGKEAEKVKSQICFLPSVSGTLSYKNYLIASGFSKSERWEATQRVLQDFPTDTWLLSRHEKLSKILHKSGFLLPSAEKLFSTLIAPTSEEEKRPRLVFIRSFGMEFLDLEQVLKKKFQITLTKLDTFPTIESFFSFLQKLTQETKEFMQFFFIQDDFKKWNEMEQKAEGGKWFPILEDHENFFFDDNENIVNARNSKGVFVPELKLPENAKIVLVHTEEIIEYEDYFLKFLQQNDSKTTKTTESFK